MLTDIILTIAAIAIAALVLVCKSESIEEWAKANHNDLHWRD